MSGAKDTEKAMLVEDDHEDMSSDEEEDTAAAQMGAAQLLKVLIEIFVWNNLLKVSFLKRSRLWRCNFDALKALKMCSAAKLH